MSTAVNEGGADGRRMEGWVGVSHSCELELGLSLDSSEDRCESAWRVSCAVARDVYEVEGLLVGAKSLKGFCCSESKVFGDSDVLPGYLLTTSYLVRAHKHDILTLR